MTRPNYCPRCGEPLPDGPHGAQPFKVSMDAGADGGWDCYCEVCKWSGDIMPDDEIGDGERSADAKGGEAMSKSPVVWVRQYLERRRRRRINLAFVRGVERSIALARAQGDVDEVKRLGVEYSQWIEATYPREKL